MEKNCGRKMGAIGVGSRTSETQNDRDEHHVNADE